MKKIKYYLKREGAFEKLRVSSAPRNSGNRKLISNCLAIRWTLLQSILDNYAVLQELWDESLEGKTDSESRSQVLGVQTQMQIFNFFSWIQMGVLVLTHTDNLSST